MQILRYVLLNKSRKFILLSSFVVVCSFILFHFIENITKHYTLFIHYVYWNTGFMRLKRIEFTTLQFLILFNHHDSIPQAYIPS